MIFIWIIREAVRGYTKLEFFRGPTLRRCPNIKEIHPKCRNELSYQFDPLLSGGLGCVFSLLWFVLVYDDPDSHPWIGISEKEYILSTLDQQVSMHKDSNPLLQTPWVSIGIPKGNEEGNKHLSDLNFAFRSAQKSGLFPSNLYSDLCPFGPFVCAVSAISG